MKDLSSQTTSAAKISTKVAMVLGKRLQHASEQYRSRLQEVATEMAPAQPRPQGALQTMSRRVNFAIDAMQRMVLVADALRERGNNFIAREQAGKPPPLHFDYEVVLDARRFERAANYALVRTVPPPGVTVDPSRRPYAIIDPRAAVLLLARHGEPLPLARLSRNREMHKDCADVLPQMAPDQWRRLRGEQEIMATDAPEQAIASLPELLADPGDRARFRSLFERLLHDPRLIGQGVTDEQQTMLARMDEALGAAVPKARPRRNAARRAAGKGARK